MRSCLPRLKPGTVLLREYQGERLTVTVVPSGYLWRETAYASLLQFSPPILKHISAIKTKLVATKGDVASRYNVQTAVDAQHHLIVAHDVTNVGHDRDQLSNMAGQAKAVMGVEALDVLADRGYFKGEEVLACEPLGVTPYVPKPLTSGSKAAGRFGKQDFVYIPEEDAYRCPADQRLTWRFTSAEKGMTLHSYWTSKCAECPLKTQCTTGKERRIKRWEHEAVIDAMQDRLDRAPKSMRVRRATVEHPLGTLKAWMGATHFKTRTLEKVRTEMSLHVLAYNLKRVIAILGAQPLMEAMRA